MQPPAVRARSLLARYAALFAERRGAVLAFVVVATALALVGLARLEFDDRPRGVFRSDDDAYRRLERLFREFGSDDDEALLVVEAEEGWFTPRTAAALRGLAREASAVPGVARVRALPGVPLLGPGLAVRPLVPVDGSPAALAAAETAARTHPLVAGHLLAEDGRTTLVAARIEGEAQEVDALRAPVEALAALAADVSAQPGIRARLTGIPPLRVEIYDTIRREQRLFMAVGSLVCFVVSWLLFRSLRACVAATVPPIVGTAWALGALGLAGVPIDLLGVVLPVLCVLIGFTDSVHLVLDVRRERAAGSGPVAAARHAIEHLGVPCALTTLTTAVGFGSLALGHVETIRRFGVICAAGVGLVLLAVLTVLPLLASALGDLGGTYFRDERPPRALALAGRAADAVARRARPVAWAAIAATALLVAVSARLAPENRLTEATPRGGGSYEALLAAERAFGGILPVFVVMEWPEGPLAQEEVVATLGEVEALFAAEPRLSRPLSALALLALLPGDGVEAARLVGALPEDVTARLVREDLRRAVVTARVPDLGRDEALPLFERLEAGLADITARRPGFTLELTGTDVVARTNLNEIIVDLARGLGVAVLVILALIAWEFRSLRLGLLSLVPNAFPLGVVGAFLVATGRPLQMVSAVLFSVLLGLAVDDTIHLLARYRAELSAGDGQRAALRRTVQLVGAAIGVTTVVLVCGYASVLVSSVPSNRLFAGLLTLGLLAALVGDLVLLPALLAAFHRPRRR